MDTSLVLLSRFGVACLRALYLFAPVLVSALLSGLVHRKNLVRCLAKPIDGGRTWRNKRIFGDGKTWRGVAIALVGSIATVGLQKYLIGDRLGSIAVIDYPSANVFLLGVTIGGGAMVGELPNSFVKRRLGIGRGETARREQRVARALFFLWDQVDLVLGVWPLLLVFWPVRFDLSLILASVALAGILHPLVAWVGFLIGARTTAR